MANPFDQNADTTNEPQLEDKDYFAELVGEDKKFKTPQDLAKGKALADAHIDNLNRTLASLRDELKTRSTVEDLVTKIEERKQQNGNATTQGENQSPDAKGAEGGLTAADVERMFQEREAQRTKEANLNTAVSKLTEMFGGDASREIANKARELGVTTEYLREQAKIAPSLVLNLFTPREPAPKDVFNAAPATSVNSGGFVKQGAGFNKKYSDFQKIQKSDPNTFYSPAFQRRIDEAVMQAQAAGKYDEFMNS